MTPFLLCRHIVMQPSSALSINLDETQTLQKPFLILIFFFTIAEITTLLFCNPEYDKPHEGVILEGEIKLFIHKGILYKTNSLGIRNKELQLSIFVNE